MTDMANTEDRLDEYTKELLDDLTRKEPGGNNQKATQPENLNGEIKELLAAAEKTANQTGPILDLFSRLKTVRKEWEISPDKFGIQKDLLTALCFKHQEMDEHGVSVGGRLNRAVPIVEEADARVEQYLAEKYHEAPSGIEIWDEILENRARIQSQLNMSDNDWNSYSGQLRYCIDSVETLSKVIDLPSAVIRDVARVTREYRMRLTPYYASLVRPGKINDPVLIQSVPTGEMVDNVGVEIPPVAADHSPARLVDQFYPQVVTIKATNMCAMYCTHCLRIAHIGKKDRIYSDQAYQEALDYIRKDQKIRDVLITGGDAFVLPNRIIRMILDALDEIGHVRLKRLGTRIPVTTPQRVDSELLNILEKSNDRKPLRVVTQINTAQEITPVSKNAFRRISQSVSAVLNQAVLLRGINDSKTKMWKLCETIQESYVRPYYVFNCSYRNPQFKHLRVPVERGRDIIESMYGNISGDAIPRYIATAGGKIPLHRDNLQSIKDNTVVLKKPWNGELVEYPDPDINEYETGDFSFSKYYEK